MKQSLLLVAPMFFTACLTEVADPASEAVEEDGQEGIIFPDDPQPRESCDLGTPLSCPSTVNFTLTAPKNLNTGAMGSARAISTTAVAVIINNGRDIACQPTSDTITSGVDHAKITIPAGFGIQRSTGPSVVFFGEIPGIFLSPPIATEGFVVCALDCDDNAPRVCGNQSSVRDDATVRINGSTRTIDLVGTVESAVKDSSGLLTTKCSLRLRKEDTRVQQSKRPNDVIAVRNGRFVRGYELTGTALSSACGALANQTCVAPSGGGGSSGGQALQQCIRERTDKCVSDFQQPDPCRTGPIETPR